MLSVEVEVTLLTDRKDVIRRGANVALPVRASVCEPPFICSHPSARLNRLGRKRQKRTNALCASGTHIDLGLQRLLLTQRNLRSPWPAICHAQLTWQLQCCRCCCAAEAHCAHDWQTSHAVHLSLWRF